ncbi:hypothetical protein [Legionella brunensis]|uniref:Uncharacterized protein n=1 Tax=Legionella brunensis TaxID=29422 RepID=A0A0W0SSE7_9GAMM|nr:hypothetical protein [Legionella brunensis]KTC86338.1 hypothetical protein Lbru_0832 [Legionella brunensis]
MSPIVFFTDPGKDGDDLIATIHVILQAKAAGIIPADTPIKLVTTDEIPCDEKGIQNPEGQYGLRALYLNMQLAKLKQQFPTLANALPEIIAGPQTTYYQYNPEKNAFYNEDSKSLAFYPAEEVNKYYAEQACDKPSCLLSPKENAAAWIEKLQESTKEGAKLVSIAAFDAVNDFIVQIPVEDLNKFSVITMGYNKPYSKSEYEQKINDLNSLPYNARSTNPNNALEIIKNLIKMRNTNIVSGTTRSLPKYDKNSWLASFMEIISRAYPIYTEQFSGTIAEENLNTPTLLSGMVEFIKHSKYQAFWPHDVVASLMLMIELGQWEKFDLGQLKTEMLFTGIEKIPANQLRLRLVEGKTGVLIDSSVANEDKDVVIGTETQSFVFGKELDAIFFTSLLHFLAIEALPKEQKEQAAALQAQYKKILTLKAQLFEMKQDAKEESVEVLKLEQQIKSAWAVTSLMELQKQLALLAAEDKLLSDDTLYILGEENPNFSLTGFTVKQAQGFQKLIDGLVSWSETCDPSLLDENLLKWIRDLAESMQQMKFELTDSMVDNLVKTLAQVSSEKQLTPLTTTLMSELRKTALFTARGSKLLEENGKLGIEFKRTGNSMLYAIAVLSGHLSNPFPTGILGMTEQYKALISLKDQSPAYQQAFLYHLAIHDAGKGDTIKEAVKVNEEGIYFILIDKNYYRLDTTAKTISQTGKEEFNLAKAHVDHDNALEAYSIVGAKIMNCSPTEFLLWGGVPTEAVDKQAIELCDELITLCNEINIAQIVQGEIPFIVVKKGLDLFFEAYKKDPKKAELVFAHHCYDIFGGVPRDSFASINAGRSPEIHLKINLLYETLIAVAEENIGSLSSREAYHRYRQKLATAIPEITQAAEKQSKEETLAKTRLAQMLRCHLFKTVTNPETKQLTIAEGGNYDARTLLFVKSIETAFAQLSKPEQEKLVELLNRNVGVTGKPAIMVMYAPKLLLTATTGSELAAKDPVDQQVIADCLTPILDLYAKLYALQASKSATYGVIDVNNLAQIIEKVFLWYQKTDITQKKAFANLLFTLQEKGLDKDFLAKLGDAKALKDETLQLAKLKEVLETTDLPFEVSAESGFIAKAETSTKTVDEKSTSEETKSGLDTKEKTLALITVEPPKPTAVEQIIAAVTQGQDKREKNDILVSKLKEESKLTVNELIELYNEVQKIKGLNEHRNPRLDTFFGLNNTTTWRHTLQEFRTIALDALFKEVESHEDLDEKLAILENAKGLPLFKDHRNNFVITGAWGRTTAVRMIDEKIADLNSLKPALA